MKNMLTALVLVLAAAAGLLAEEKSNAARRPNIVFILADDLGYTDLACYGSKYYETPNIDALAKAGIRFTSGHTCGPNCQPTRAALLSGQYGPRTGVYTVGGIGRFAWESQKLRPVENVVNLAPEKTTIAEALKQAGYATGMFGKWHLGEGPQHHPSAQGFEEAIVTMGKHFDFNTNPKVDYPKNEYLADFLTNKAVDFIQRHKERPFFLYLPHFGVHAPVEAKKKWVEHFQGKPPAGGHKNPTYAGMIASVDESVGRVIATLDELKLSDNTLVIFSSDNGGVGGYAREGIQGGDNTDNVPLKGGKGMLYEGGIRVPYIFRWPGKIAADTTNETPINSVDLYPTLLAVAGVQPPAGYTLDGTSYWNVLEGETSSARPPLFWHFPGYLGAGGNTWRTKPGGVILAGDWKLIEYFEDGHLELYNLKEDLGEKQNLASAQPEKAKDLHHQLVAWRKQVNAPMPTPNTNPTKPDAGRKKKKKAESDE